MLKRIFRNRVLWAVFAVSVFVAVMSVTGIGCPIKYLTGISCAGCGMTRALLCALSLNFEEAFAYHPLWAALIPVCVMLAVLEIKKKKRAFYRLLSVFALVMLAVWICRLALASNGTVTCDISSGLIYKLLG